MIFNKELFVQGTIILAAIFGIAIFLMLMIYPIVFWVRMLIDCINRDFHKENDKIVWILVILFGNVLGAILYYYCVKNKK